MRHLLLPLVLLAGCTKAGTGHDSPPEQAPAPTTRATPAVAPFAQPPPPTTTTKPAPTPTKVELTAVTLADDCGGQPPWSAPAKRATALKLKAKRDSAKGDIDDSAGYSRAKRRCEQTSMQLAIIAGDASKIHVKSVELFDDAGNSLGTLTASKPTRWSDASSSYETWDESVATGSTSNVSYVLAQPKWGQIANRWNRTYTLKTVLSVGGVDQTAQKDVTLTLSAPTTLPPNVKT